MRRLAVVISAVVLLACGMPAQQNPTTNWQALKDSARMRPLSDAPKPIEYPALLEQSRSTTSTLNQSMAALDRCGTCSDADYTQVRQAADEAGRAFSAAWLQTNAALIEALRDRIEQARQGSARFIEQRDRLTSELSQTQGQVDRLQQDLQQANARALGILRSNMSTLDKAAQLDVLTADMNIRQKALDSMLNNMKQWQRLIDANMPSVSRTEQYISDLERRMTAAQQENQNIHGVQIALQFYLQAKDMDRSLRAQVNLPEPPAPAFSGLAFLSGEPAGDADASSKTTRELQKSTEDRMRKLEECTKRRSFQACANEYPAGGMR